MNTHSDAREGADEARLALVRSLGVVGTPPEPAFDALAASAARIAGCPIGVISIVDEERLWFKASVGLDVDSIAREGSCCTYAIEGNALLELPDLLEDSRFRDHELVAGGLLLRFYAGHPIEVMGHNVGTLCVLDHVPRQLAPVDRALLAQLSVTAAELLLSRRRMREAVHERQRLLDFGRAGGDWMWESDAAHRYLWLSEHFDASTGLSGAAQVGQAIADSEVLGADGTPLQPALRYHDVLERHADFARVLTTKPSPNGVLYLSRSAVPIFDATGRFGGYRGTVRNVTAQLLAQRKLHERDLLLAKVGSQVPGVIFQYRMHQDGSASFPYASERTRELLGTSARDDPQAAFRLMLPDDRQSLEQAIVQSARSLKPLMQKSRLVRADGSLRWIDIFATPERLPDGSTLWHGFAADITERRNTEQALHLNQAQWELAAEAAAIGLARLSLADHIVRLDARACINHGLPYPAPALTLSDWMNTIEPEDRRGAAAGVRQVLSEGTPFEARYRVRHPNGSLRWLEFVMRPTRAADGTVDGLTGICRDVHDQQTSAQIERARQDAERASYAKSQFLSRLSHELRTPLNGILGFAQLMGRDQEQPLPPRQTERLVSMQRAGAHLLGLIDDVLEISRTGANEGTLRLEPVDLHIALASAMDCLQALATERRIALQLVGQGSVDASTDAWALGERRRVEQVVVNLLSNAIKYSAAGSRVSLGLVTRHREVGVAVRDEGPGLDADQRARLFQPFERLGAERLLIEGIGLGLFIARQLSEAMGGCIEVDSTPGAGSTFTLWLQVATAAQASAADFDPVEPAVAIGQRLAAPHGGDSADAAAVTRQIVYIEDESLNQLLLQEMLRSRNHWRLHIAPDGATGLRLAKALRPDLLLIDINLPDTSGLALVRELRSEPVLQQVRCIALSADAMQDQIKAAIAAGFDDYWTKPLNVSDVLASLDAILG